MWDSTVFQLCSVRRNEGGDDVGANVTTKLLFFGFVDRSSSTHTDFEFNRSNPKPLISGQLKQSL
jgi:hypothetical protein